MRQFFQNFHGCLWFAIVLSCTYSFGLTAQGSPIPGAHGALLSKPQGGLFFLARGFVLPSEGTHWVFENSQSDLQPEKESKQNLESVVYSLKNSPTARFSVNIDNLKKESTLENYSRKWAKEYHQYGFDLIRSKPFKLNSALGVVYDLKARNKPVQIRQVIFLKDKVAVTMTCSDEIKSFSTSFPECDRMVRNFRWSEK